MKRHEVSARILFEEIWYWQCVRSLGRGGGWQGINEASASIDGSGGADKAASAAAQHAATLMADPQAANDEIALMFLPWLVGAAPPQALTVLKVLSPPHREDLRTAEIWLLRIWSSLWSLSVVHFPIPDFVNTGTLSDGTSTTEVRSDCIT